MTSNPGGQEHVNAARTAEERVRLLLEITDHPNLGEEIAYDRRFNTEAWPRDGYALQRSDLLAVLDELDRARGKVGELEKDNTLQRQDIEDLQNEKEDLEGALRKAGLR